MADPLAFGDYRLLRRIGAGGMAEVFLAKRLGARGFEKQLVIKRILPHLSASEQSAEHFLREARYAALIDHPNLVHVSDFGERNGSLYLAMEFVAGITVSELLRMVGSVSPPLACRIAMEVSAALHAIHTAHDEQGQPLHLVHRDVTPRNVMITRDGGVKLLDFGIALPRELAATSAMGTRQHMSPEQIASEFQDHRSDLFALGVLLYEMIVGRPPFDGVPVASPERPPSVPTALWDMLLSLLALKPDDRPSSALAVQSFLELYIGSMGIEGTRAHLSEVVASFMPPPAGALRRLTERTMTRILRLTASIESDEAKESEEGSKRRSPLRALPALGLLIGLGLTAVFLSRGDASRPRPPAEATHPRERAAGAPVSTPARPEVAGGLEPAKRAEAVASPGVAPGPAPVAPTPSPDAGPEGPRDPPKTSPSGDALVDASRHEARPEPREGAPKRPRSTGIGSLTIDTKPWSDVYLEGKKLGMTPLDRVPLPSGTHELELKNPSLGREGRVRVKIRAGRETRINVPLTAR